MIIKYSQTTSVSLMTPCWIFGFGWKGQSQGNVGSLDGLDKLLQGTILLFCLLFFPLCPLLWHINDRVTGIWLFCNRWYRRIEVTVSQATEQSLQVFSKNVFGASTHSSHLLCVSFTQSSAPSWIPPGPNAFFFTAEGQWCQQRRIAQMLGE